jgi:hypothetical protein
MSPLPVRLKIDLRERVQTAVTRQSRDDWSQPNMTIRDVDDENTVW